MLYNSLTHSKKPETETWRPVHAPILGSSVRHSAHVSVPNLRQRRRVLDLLTTLTPHYTKECTRGAQSMYIHQARERYASLIGHQRKSRASWLDTLGLNGVGGGDALDMDSDGFGGAVHESMKRDLVPDGHKYFFAINLYNSFDVIPDLFATLFRVGAVLGYHNIFVSIYENGSTDQTPALLRIFDALMRSTGMRVAIKSSTRRRGIHVHRIEYLAEVRNAAMGPLFELRDSENEYFDTVVFMNDILPCVDDVLELIWQSRRQNAGVTCAADYMYHDEIVS